VLLVLGPFHESLGGMLKALAFTLLLCFLLIGCVTNGTGVGQMGELKLTSPAFRNNETIPAKYTCDGNNVNPQLEIAGIPEDAKSLALIMDDPDAPSGTWVHWLVWNISPISRISEEDVPTGAVEGITSFGKSGYGGPCPPSGTHRYFFKLYALDAKLDLNQNAKKPDLENAIKGHILAKTELIGLYSRK
jgi:Raf kinase inhibitor-like YbhB/YbcL family protein